MLRIFNKYRENELIKNYTKVFSVDFLVRASNFILLPLYLKLMTQAEFGLYTYIFAVISTFSMVLNFGFYVPQSKLYQDYDDPVKKGELLFTINSLLLVLLSIVIVITYLTGFDYLVVKFLFSNPVDYGNYRTSVFTAIVFSVLSYMLTNYFLTSQKIKYVQFYNASRLFIVNISVLLILYWMQGDKVGIRLRSTYYLEFLLMLIFGYFFVKQMVFNFRKDLVRKILFLSFPVMFSAVLGLVLNFGDKFFLEKYVGFGDLAIYNLAYNFAAIIPLMFVSFQNVWLPYFFREKDVKENKRKTKSFVIKISAFFLLSSLMIIGVFWLFLEFSIISSEYSRVLMILPVMLVTQIFVAVTVLYSNYIIFFEKTYFAIVIGVPLAVISVFVNIFLISRFGLFGAAFSALLINLSYLLSYYAAFKYLYKKHTDKFPENDISRTSGQFKE